MAKTPAQLKNLAYRYIGLYRRSIQFKTCEKCNRTMCPMCFSIGPSSLDKVLKLKRGIESTVIDIDEDLLEM